MDSVWAFNRHFYLFCRGENSRYRRLIDLARLSVRISNHRVDAALHGDYDSEKNKKSDHGSFALVR